MSDSSSQCKYQSIYPVTMYIVQILTRGPSSGILPTITSPTCQRDAE